MASASDLLEYIGLFVFFGCSALGLLLGLLLGNEKVFECMCVLGFCLFLLIGLFGIPLRWLFGIFLAILGLW